MSQNITVVQNTDFARLMQPGPERLQDLQGFDADYVDIVNYIVRCTHKIWEEMGMGLIYTHYLHNAKVHTGDGWFLGRDQVVANSVQALSAMPDDRAYAEAVVWTGDDFLGLPATGRHVKMRVMDFYRCDDRTICENWVPFDIPHLLNQLGVDVFRRMRLQFRQTDKLSVRSWLLRA